jgi:hypothetical protein
MKRSQASS